MRSPQLFLLPKTISHVDWLFQQALHAAISPAAIFMTSLAADDIRDLISRAQTISAQTPSAFLLPNLETASLAAQNALLKILEEPPAHIHFFLAASDLTKILSTIKSRVSTLTPQIDTQKKIDASIISVWQLSELKLKSAGEIIANSDKLLADIVVLVDDGVEDKKTVLERNALHLLLPELINLYRADSASAAPAPAIATLALVQKSYQYLLANISPKLILSDLFLQIHSLFGKIDS